MSLFTPRFLQIVESHPEVVAQFHVVARKTSDQTEVAGANYACVSNPQNIPIGANGFFDNTPDGTEVEIFVLEVPVSGHGENTTYQQAPGGPFTVTRLADGIESLAVTV